MLNEPPDDPSYTIDPSNKHDDGCKAPRGFFEASVETTRKHAATLHNDHNWLYGLFGILDGLNCSFSILRYYFDAYYANSSDSSADMLHDWLMTPEGAAFLIIESSMFMVGAYYGNQYDTKNLSKKDTTWRGGIALYWPYFRDGMKALKNGYRGVRNAIVFAEMMSIVSNVRYLVMPAGIALGAISMVNRPLLRKIRDKRTAESKQLSALIIEMEGFQTKFNPSNQAELNSFRKALDDQQQKINDELNQNNTPNLWKNEFKSQDFWLLAYCSATFNGLLDAPNLYFGAITLTVMAPAPWIMIAVAIFATVCLITRIFEEYDGQRQWLLVQSNLKLELSRNKLALFLDELKIHSGCNTGTLEERETTKQGIYKQLNEAMLEYTQHLNDRDKHSVRPFWSILLAAMTNGIDAYGALSSMIFAISTIYLMLSIPFPPLLLITFIVTGTLCLTLPVVYAIKEAYFNPTSPTTTTQPIPIEGLFSVETLQKRIETGGIDKTKENMMAKGAALPSQHVFYKDWFEICRLLFAGVNKGSRSAEFVILAAEVLHNDGQHPDPDSILALAGVAAAFFGGVFLLKGITKVRDKTSPSIAPKTKTIETVVSDPVADEKKEPAPKTCTSWLTTVGFFNRGSTIISGHTQTLAPSRAQ